MDASLVPNLGDIPNVAFGIGNTAATVASLGVTGVAALAPVPTSVPFSIPEGSSAGGSGIPENCHPSFTPEIQDLGDLTGQVCQFTFPNNLLSIDSCCDGRTKPNMQGNCTQFCEVSTSKDKFQSCVKGLVGKLPKEERPKNWKVQCQTAGQGMGASATKGAGSNGANNLSRGISVTGLVGFAMAFVFFLGV